MNELIIADSEVELNSFISLFEEEKNKSVHTKREENKKKRWKKIFLERENQNRSKREKQNQKYFCFIASKIQE